MIQRLYNISLERNKREVERFKKRREVGALRPPQAHRRALNLETRSPYLSSYGLSSGGSVLRRGTSVKVIEGGI